MLSVKAAAITADGLRGATGLNSPKRHFYVVGDIKHAIRELPRSMTLADDSGAKNNPITFPNVPSAPVNVPIAVKALRSMLGAICVVSLVHLFSLSSIPRKPHPPKLLGSRGWG